MASAGIIPSLIGSPLAGAGGVALGTIEELRFDPLTNRPAWLLVRRHDGSSALVPARGMTSGLNGVAVPYAPASEPLANAA